MMLSRVAERVYWAARYLERIESTARLVSSYESLLLDLHSDVKLSWYNLIIITDQQEAFNERYSNRSERNIIKFLIGDSDNSSSLINSLQCVRENVRTTRDVVPEEAWEQICELTIYARDNLEQGVNRRSRYQYLDDIIKGCAQINGLLLSNMPKDASWEFLSIGRNLEVADMTARFLEAGLEAVLILEDDNAAVNSQQTIWGSVLRSLNASQYYLRTTKAPVKGDEVMPYLLHDTVFPKSIHHCVVSVIRSCESLPNSEAVVKRLKTLERKLVKKIDFQNVSNELLEYVHQLQVSILGIHSVVSDTWFIAE